MTRSNPYLQLFEERFGAPSGAAAAIVRALPALRDGIAEEAERLAAEAIRGKSPPGEDAPVVPLSPGEVARIEALRPTTARVMLGGVGEVFAAAVGEPEPAAMLLHALEHELMLPQSARAEPGAAGDPADADLVAAVSAAMGDQQGIGLGAIGWTLNAWRRDGTHVARGVLFGEPSPEPVAAAGTAGEPEGATVSPREPAAEPRVYASMGRRLVAVLADMTIVYALWILVLVMAGLSGAPIDDQDPLPQWVAWPSVMAYFFLFQARWHASPGKALLGLAVEADHPEGMGWNGRVLLREIVGRFLNQLLFGAGYWTALSHPHRQSWGDRMAGTVVVRRPSATWLRRTGRIALPISAALVILTLLAAGWSSDVERGTQEIRREFESLGSELGACRARLDTLMTRGVATADEYRADMQASLVEAERLDRAARRGLELAQRSRSWLVAIVPSARRDHERVEQVWRLGMDEAAAYRRQAELGLRQCSDGTPRGLLSHRMAICGSDVSAIQRRITRLASWEDAE